MTSRFTPELALVDPDLADVLKAFLADPSDCLDRHTIVPLRSRMLLAPDAVLPPSLRRAPDVATRPATTIAVAHAALEPTIDAAPAPRPVMVGTRPQPRPAAGPARGSRLPHYAAWLGTLAILGVPLLAFLPPADSLRPRFVDQPLAGGSSIERPVSTPATSSATPRGAAAASAVRQRATSGGVSRAGARASATAPDKTARSSAAKARAKQRPDTATSRQAPTTTASGGSAKQQAAARPAAKPQTGRGTSDRRASDLAWPAVRGADLYNVILTRDGKRRDIWVKANTINLDRFAPVARAGTTVGYGWYVYPLYRDDQEFRFGELLAKGSVRLPADAITG